MHTVHLFDHDSESIGVLGAYELRQAVFVHKIQASMYDNIRMLTIKGCVQ